MQKFWTVFVPQRLDTFLRQAVPAELGVAISNSKIRRLIVAGAVTVDTVQCRVPAFLLKQGTRVSATIDTTKFFFEKQPTDIAFTLSERDVLYEDDIQESHVLYKFKEEKPFTITKDKDVFVVSGEKIEKLFKMTRFNTEEAFVVFSNKLRKMGLDDELIKMNIQEGDTVRILDYEFEYRK